jgi:hypothetical protein
MDDFGIFKTCRTRSRAVHSFRVEESGFSSMFTRRLEQCGEHRFRRICAAPPRTVEPAEARRVEPAEARRAEPAEARRRRGPKGRARRGPKGRGSRCAAARAAIRFGGQVGEGVLKCTIAPGFGRIGDPSSPSFSPYLSPPSSLPVTASGVVPATDPDPREARRICKRIKEKQKQKPEFGRRIPIERPVLRALGSRLLIPPGGGCQWECKEKIRKLGRRSPS